MLLEYLLAHSVLAQVEHGGRAGQDLGHLPPSRPFSLECLAGATVDVEEPGDHQLEVVEVCAHQGPEGEHTWRLRVNQLDELCVYEETIMKCCNFYFYFFNIYKTQNKHKIYINAV